MLLSKLFVPINIHFAIQNLTKLQNSLFSAQCTVAQKGNICPKPHVTSNPFTLNRCEKNRESLNRCPRAQPNQDCKSSASKESQSKCPDASQTASDAYKRAFAEVRKEALNLQIFTRNSTNAVLGSMSAATAGRAGLDRGRMLRMLGEIEAKVGEIEGMNLVCGANKRHGMFDISERINANLQVWHCENEAGVRCLRCRLEDLGCRVKERTDTAVEILRTCRGCVSARTLILCTDMTARDASCILKTTEEYARRELASIELLKGQILHENDRIIEGLMNSFEAEVKDFSKHLDLCIVELRKMLRR